MPQRAVADVPADDCVESGRHILLLPEAKSRGTIEGRCDKCGLRRRYPATWYELTHHARRTRRTERPTPRAAFAPPVQEGDGGDWASVVDAVFYLRAGRDADIARLAAQLPPGDASDPPGIVTDRLVRSLEAAGHIEVVRSKDGRAVQWQVTPPCLAGTAEATFALTGWRSPAYLAALHTAVGYVGGSLEKQAAIDGPPVVFVRGLAGPALVETLELHELDPMPGVVDDAAAALAGALPPLSWVYASLADEPVPPARSMKAWDPSTARWQAASAVRDGAVQFGGFSVAYGFVRTTGGERTMKAGDSRLVKHLAAWASGIALIDYSPELEQLVVPMGADLPGLYARAAVLASGRLPAVNERQGALIYQSVPERVAATLIERLGS